MATLLVILNESISDLLEKGEYTPRYYNPGEVFDEVHFLLANADRPDPARLQYTVGRARLEVHNLPAAKLFVRTLGWQPLLLAGWARPAVDLARRIRPALERCYGAGLNTFLAAQIKQALGVPFVASLHTNPVASVAVLELGALGRLYEAMRRRLERYGLLRADRVLPVYEPIIPYLEGLGVGNYEVCYNALDSQIQRKQDYALHRPARIACTGRQIPGKDPSPLIRAVARLPDVQLTLFGDGPLHAGLGALAAELGVAERVTLVKRIENAELCRQLPEFDVFAARSDYFEISKSVLEPLLTGLPVVHNRRPGAQVPELQGDFACLVEPTEAGYFEALSRLLADDAAREALGRAAYAHAQARWAPERTEAKYAEVHRRYMRAVV